MNWDWDKLQEKRERQQRQRPAFPESRQDERDEYDDDREERRNRRSPFGGDPRGGLPKLPKWQLPNGLLIGGGVLVVLAVWLLSGIYIVNPGEEGVVLRFGKYDRTVGPGPHYALPAPIEKVYKPQVSRVLRSEVGYRSPGESRTYQKGQVRPIPAEASMLTGDENIVNVQFSVQYRIADPVAYLFNIYEPDMLVRSAAMHDLELPLEKMFTPEFFSRLRAEGVEVINLHHALKENPFINLPYTAASLPYLQQFVEQAHREELKVCLYYTIRELSVHAPEFWAFAAMRGEILFPGPGNEARPETAPMGAHPYLQTNCRFGYLSAWAEAVKEGPHAGELDLAVETAPGRRFENYYLEGLRYLLERCPIDGLYLDDISLSREGFRRLGTIFRSIRKCEPILNLHSWNSYNPRFPNYGNASPVLRDLHFYPFLSSLWIGEAFDYEGTSPDYYLTEISGLPFGLMSEMLDRGGNPWRGMLFAMTGRLGWLADPRPLWKLFDSFDLAHSRMITFCDAAPAVRCSAPAVDSSTCRDSWVEVLEMMLTASAS